MDLSQVSKDDFDIHDHTRRLSSTWMQLCFKVPRHEGRDKFRNAQRQTEVSNSRKKKVEETKVLSLQSLLSGELPRPPHAPLETGRHILTNYSGFWPRALLADMVQNPWETFNVWPACYGLTRPNVVIAVLNRKRGHGCSKNRTGRTPPLLGAGSGGQGGSFSFWRGIFTFSSRVSLTALNSAPPQKGKEQGRKTHPTTVLLPQSSPSAKVR